MPWPGSLGRVGRPPSSPRSTTQSGQSLQESGQKPPQVHAQPEQGPEHLQHFHKEVGDGGRVQVNDEVSGPLHHAGAGGQEEGEGGAAPEVKD